MIKQYSDSVSQSSSPASRAVFKRTVDGRVLLNLGCGTKMHAAWNNIDFSVYARLRRHMGAVRLLRRAGVISPARFAQFSLVDPEIIAWNLARGIPFPDGSADAVYHSHVLEHIERHAAIRFLEDCRRVLKPGGVIRVVVPDLEKWSRQYLDSLQSQPVPPQVQEHEKIVEELLLQLTEREPLTRKAQKPFVQWLERTVLGDGARIGWQHRWMYDRLQLEAALSRAGFSECRVMSAWESRIEGWTTFGLDTEDDGSEYKPESLRMEAVRRR
jgi:SAM-dependent methyltransferase